MGLLGTLIKAVGSAWGALWASGRDKDDLLMWMAENADDPDSWAYIPKWHSYGNIYRRIKNKDHLKVADEFIRDTAEPVESGKNNLPYYLIGGMILFGVMK
tara:strand:- start:86 stop:388 length:303 start_codon:yes stop_codon:yes gene_type:complete